MSMNNVYLVLVVQKNTKLKLRFVQLKSCGKNMHPDTRSVILFLNEEWEGFYKG
jgi:hypothetical protein